MLLTVDAWWEGGTNAGLVVGGLLFFSFDFEIYTDTPAMAAVGFKNLE